MELSLLVIRTGDIARPADFYRLLGLEFEYHKHERSPYHYSATIGNTVLEIYPLARGQAEPDKELRLGFLLDNFDSVIGILREHQASFVSEPMHTAYGFSAIVKDPDGRKIELYKNGE